jgi:hypothetical protein
LAGNAELVFYYWGRTVSCPLLKVGAENPTYCSIQDFMWFEKPSHSTIAFQLQHESRSRASRWHHDLPMLAKELGWKIESQPKKS